MQPEHECSTLSRRDILLHTLSITAYYVNTLFNDQTALSVDSLLNYSPSDDTLEMAESLHRYISTEIKHQWKLKRSIDSECVHTLIDKFLSSIAENIQRIEVSVALMWFSLDSLETPLVPTRLYEKLLTVLKSRDGRECSTKYDFIQIRAIQRVLLDSMQPMECLHMLLTLESWNNILQACSDKNHENAVQNFCIIKYFQIFGPDPRSSIGYQISMRNIPYSVVFVELLLVHAKSFKISLQQKDVLLSMERKKSLNGLDDQRESSPRPVEYVDQSSEPMENMIKSPRGKDINQKLPTESFEGGKSIGTASTSVMLILGLAVVFWKMRPTS